MKRLLPLLLILSGCALTDPDASKFLPPEIVSVSAAQGADYSEVLLACTVRGAGHITACGFVFDQTRIPAEGIDGEVFTAKADGLLHSTDHTFRAYIENGRDITWSEEKTYRTADEVPPSPAIITLTPSLGKDAGAVRIQGRIPDWTLVVQQSALSAGICFSADTPLPGMQDGKEEAGSISAEGVFEVNLAGLAHTREYYFRPYATIGGQTSFGEVRQLLIPSMDDVVRTGDYSSLSAKSVILQGALRWEESYGPLLFYGFEVNGKALPSGNRDASQAFSLMLNDLTPETKYEYRALVRIGEATFYGELRSFTTPALSPEPESDCVDLGLGVLWATCDLGAQKPEQTGLRFAWGETATKGQYEYDWAHYKWCYGTPESLFKYTAGHDCVNADEKTRLESADDAATVLLGSAWHTPDATEWGEMLGSCKMSKISRNGVLVIEARSQVPGYEDRSILLPSTAYWTAELCSSISRGALIATTYPDDVAFSVLDYGIESATSPEELFIRCQGLPIRPVREK